MMHNNKNAQGRAVVRQAVELLEPRRLFAAFPANPVTEINVDGTRYFAQNADGKGVELWKGNSSGTSLVADVRGGGAGSNPRGFVVFKNLVYFIADTDNGKTLYKTDGTAGGTTAVIGMTDIPQENDGPESIAVSGNFLYFARFQLGLGSELWKTDGTDAGSSLVKELYDHGAGSEPHDLTDVSGVLYFVATPGTFNERVYRTDGTELGTTLLESDFSEPDYASNLTNLNGALLFSANGAGAGTELWKVAAGATVPTLVKDIRTGDQGSNPADFVLRNGQVEFTADDGRGIKRWTTDGTAAGTTLVATGVSATADTFKLATNGVLRIYGSTGDDTIVVRQNARRTSRLEVTYNGTTTVFEYADVTRIRIDGGAGDDQIDLANLNIPATLYGSAGADLLTGGNRPDRLFGGDNNDQLFGGRSNDILYGDNGNDSVYGENGNDYVFGNTGLDFLNGGRGRDRVNYSLDDDFTVDRTDYMIVDIYSPETP